MKKIELEPYDLKDLLYVLDYAQEEFKYRAHFESDGMSRYWIQRIDQLKKIVKGQTFNSIKGIASTMQTFDR